MSTGPNLSGKRLPAANSDDFVRFTFDGQELTACAGTSVAAALLAAGHHELRITKRNGEPRGMFCGMGVCFDCLVEIDGRPNVRACRATVAEGMRVCTQRGAGTWEEAC